MSFYTRRNIVPGNWRGIKIKGRGTRQVLNPGYDLKDMDSPDWYGNLARRDAKRSIARWYKPFKSKPIKRREKRGQGKPR